MNEQSILYQDADFFVIDKPSGITVNRADTTRNEETVQDYIEKTYKELFATSDGSDFYLRGGIVHRLDKETSGILLVAKNPLSFVELQRQFKERLVKKTYQALAHGQLIQPGEISVPVGRLPWNRKRFGVIAGGRDSVTKYSILGHYLYKSGKASEKLTLLELYPETGRTHQIRVHLKHINHPIFSDFLYAGRKTARDDRKLLERVFLHAAKISFFHPTTKEQVSFASSLPIELTKVLETMEKEQA